MTTTLGRSEAAERLAQCRAILGGAHDALRTIWDERASGKDRRLLLAMSGRQGPEWARLASYPWGALPGEVRSEIAAGLRRFKTWAAELEQ